MTSYDCRPDFSNIFQKIKVHDLFNFIHSRQHNEKESCFTSKTVKKTKGMQCGMMFFYYLQSSDISKHFLLIKNFDYFKTRFQG